MKPELSFLCRGEIEGDGAQICSSIHIDIRCMQKRIQQGTLGSKAADALGRMNITTGRMDNTTKKLFPNLPDVSLQL